MQSTPPRRRWFQFSLRTMLLLVMVLAALTATVGGLSRRATRLKLEAARHAQNEGAARERMFNFVGPPLTQKDFDYLRWAEELADYHCRIKNKRCETVWRPWLAYQNDPEAPPDPRLKSTHTEAH